MSVSPNEILTKVLDNEKNFIDRTEEAIDNRLRQEYKGDNQVTVWFTGADFRAVLTPRILNELKKRYPEWKIGHRWSEDQRDDGGSLTFDAKK